MIAIPKSVADFLGNKIEGRYTYAMNMDQMDFGRHEMRTGSRLVAILASCLTALSFVSFGNAGDAQIPKPDGKPADMTKPVQVFILLGQSNMVGLGKVKGGDT